jgi:hypothetical protein
MITFKEPTAFAATDEQIFASNLYLLQFVLKFRV